MAGCGWPVAGPRQRGADCRLVGGLRRHPRRVGSSFFAPRPSSGVTLGAAGRTCTVRGPVAMGMFKSVFKLIIMGRRSSSSCWQAVLVAGGFLLRRPSASRAAPRRRLRRTKSMRSLPTRGAGREWSVWNRRDQAMRIEITAAPRPAPGASGLAEQVRGRRQMTFTAARPASSSHSTSTSRLAPRPGRGCASRRGDGTRVTWTMNGDFGTNPADALVHAARRPHHRPDFDGGSPTHRR